MIEFVIPVEELDEELDEHPCTHIAFDEEGVHVEFDSRDPEQHDEDCVSLADKIHAREHDDDYENHDEDWILSYHPTL